MKKLLLTTIILGTSFMPVSAADIVTEYNVGIKNSAAIEESNAEEHFELGNKLLDEEKYSEAIDEFSRAIELDPNFVDAYYERGNAYDELNKYDEAIRDYSKVIELEPNDVFAYADRALLYSDLGRYEESISDSTKVIEMNPDFAFLFYFIRAEAYINLEMPDEVVQDLSKFIDFAKHNELSPNDSKRYMEILPLVYMTRGFMYDLTEKYDESIRDYTKAIQLDPNSSLAYNARGEAYYALSRYAEAFRDLNKSIELEPDNADFYISRGNAYQNLGNYDLAIENLEKALELDPENEDAKNYLDEIHQKIQQ